ncbi:MAG: ParB/RepB/Spo0J family partition protein [Bacteroidales bacterium]|nr:ParB/RepB/Spo0J family partition protein [Bacteroidales bacterium]
MVAKKMALGRGLSALLESSNYEKADGSNIGANSTGVIADILLDSILTNADQPRKEFDLELLEELAESIKQQGIIQPITVRKVSKNKYELISGERRYRASKIIALKSIPAYVREANDTQALEMALVENIQRQDLNSLEIALSYQHLIQDCDISMEDIGKKVGKKRSTVNNYLRLLKLPNKIQIGLRENKITMGHARALISIELEQDQVFIFEEIIKNRLSVRQVEELSRKIQDKSSNTKGKVKVNLPYKYEKYSSKLAKQFGKGTLIKRNPKGKGSVNISFNNDDELDKLLEQLLNS